MKHGLSESEIKQIKDVFEKYSDVRTVYIYGSRAKNTFTAKSDIDLAVEFKPNATTNIGTIKSDLEDLPIIFEFDLTDQADITPGKFQDAYNLTKQVFHKVGWTETTVKSLVENNILEKPLDGNHGNIHPKSEDFTNNGVPFIMASDLKDGKVDTLTCNFLSENSSLKLKKGFAKNGDVLLSHKATIGRNALLNSKYPFVVLSPQVTYYRVKDKSKLDNKFLKYYFDSERFQTVLANYAGSGSTRAYIGITSQLDLPIHLPALDEQKSIAEILFAFDDKIELLRDQNKTLESLGQTIFKEWFGKYSPDRPEELPEGWRFEDLNNISEILFGFNFKSKLFNEDGNGTKVVRIRDILKGSTNTSSPQNVPSQYEIKPGDLLIGMDGVFHCSIWSDYGAYINQRVAKITSHLPTYYIYESIRSQLDFLQKTIIGATVGHLSNGDIRSFKIILPEDISLLNIFREITIKVLNIKNQIKKLSITRNQIIQEVF